MQEGPVRGGGKFDFGQFKIDSWRTGELVEKSSLMVMGCQVGVTSGATMWEAKREFAPAKKGNF